MIIHITGPSGGGKSYIGNQLKRAGYKVIDTDYINDKNALDVLKSDGKFSRKKIKKLDTKKFVEIISEKIPDNNPIIIVGRIIDMDDVMKKIKGRVLHGIYLDVEPRTVFRQLNSRHVNIIKNRADEILKLLKSDINLDTIGGLLLHKFELRRPLFTFQDDIEKGIKNDINNLKKSVYKYKILAPAEVASYIKKLIARPE